MRDDIIRFARELEEEGNRAFDLWTWLPSYKAAERAHGDYGSSNFPGVSHVLTEANLVLQDLLDGVDPEKINRDHTDSVEKKSFYACPCGECPESFPPMTHLEMYGEPE